MVAFALRQFFWLAFVHALCDFPLQGDFLSRGKNRMAPIAGVPWWICLSAHALIHAGFVLLITDSMALATAEAVLHWLIDYSKCEGWFGFATDQALHLNCKLAWALMLTAKVFAS